MLTEAQKASPAVDFNRQYPNSAASVVEPHVVPGAFTRSGFTFMQDAVHHPDRYFQGETWVLGDQAGAFARHRERQQAIGRDLLR